MNLRILAICIALVGAGLMGISACDNMNSNTNANANANANASAATPEATATASPEQTRGNYSERQAQEEREKAKANNETIGDTLDDAWIHTKIVAKLIANSTTPERKINVVTLRGTVDTAEEKAAAEKTAKDTDGVKSVVNQLKVAPAAKASPAAKTSGKTKPNY